MTTRWCPRSADGACALGGQRRVAVGLREPQRQVLRGWAAPTRGRARRRTRRRRPGRRPSPRTGRAVDGHRRLGARRASGRGRRGRRGSRRSRRRRSPGRDPARWRRRRRRRRRAARSRARRRPGGTSRTGAATPNRRSRRASVPGASRARVRRDGTREGRHRRRCWTLSWSSRRMRGQHLSGVTPLGGFSPGELSPCLCGIAAYGRLCRSDEERRREPFVSASTQLEGGVAGDAELISAARSGDTAAIGALYERHAGAAWVVARQYSDSPEDADDVVADSFTAVFGAIERRQRTRSRVPRLPLHRRPSGGRARAEEQPPRPADRRHRRRSRRAPALGRDRGGPGARGLRARGRRARLPLAARAVAGRALVHRGRVV